jgi:son of sevenless-like protein
MNMEVRFLDVFQLWFSSSKSTSIDPTFIKTYLMTYKSFTNLDELFDLLTKRFRIQPPDNLNPQELEEWGKLKQHVIQMRLVMFGQHRIRFLNLWFCSVINTFKSMVVDDDILEKEDMYILDHMKAFISGEQVIKYAAAKQLLILIERAVGVSLNCLGLFLTLELATRW